MPVMPGYKYADEPHEKTVTGAGFRYGCHNTVRNNDAVILVQDGWNDDGTRRMIESVWEPLKHIKCGHDVKHVDSACQGCFNI